MVFNDSKQYDKARDAYELALAVRRELKDRRGEGTTLANLGEVYVNLGQQEKARQHFGQGLLIAREVKNKNGEEFALTKLGLLSFDRREMEQGVEHFERVLELRRERGALVEVRHSLNLLGTHHAFNARRPEKALPYLEESLEISKRLRDRPGESQALLYLGLAQRAAFQYEQARQYMQQALAIRRELGDKVGEADILQHLGSLHSGGFQDCDKAREILEQALAIKSASPDREGESAVLSSLSTAHLCLGNNEKVIEYSERALAIKKELNDEAGQILFLNSIAGAYGNSGLFEKARGYYERALAIAREKRLASEEASTLGMLANNYDSLEQYEKALELYEHTLAIAKRINELTLLKHTLRSTASVYARLKQNDKALEYYKQALALCRESKDIAGEVSNLHSLGLFHASLRQFEQARTHYEQALALARNHRLPNSEVYLLSSIGNLYNSLGQYEKALDYHEQALALARRMNHDRYVNSGLTYVGNTYVRLYQYEKAREYLEQALAGARVRKNVFNEALASVGLGIVYLNLNEYEKARDSYERALVLSRETTHPGLVGLSAGGVGDLYADLNQSRRAQGSYEQSLALMKEVLNRRGEGQVRNALGSTYLNLKQYDKARGFYEEALAIAREVGEKRDEASALINLGTTYKDPGQYEKARPFYEQGLALAREVSDPGFEAAALHGLGEVYLNTERLDKAHDSYRRSLASAREAKSRKREAEALWGLMALWNRRKNPRSAVYYGKQAVNTFQAMRGALKGFDRETQQTFLENKQEAYRTLAETLIALGRIPEAEQVLAMLKEEELFNFVRRDDAVAKELLGRIPLNDPERAAFERYEALADRVTAVGRRVAELEEESRKYEAGRFPRQPELDELEARLAEATKVFNRFFDELSEKFYNAATRQKDVRVAQLSSTQALLAGLKQPRTVVVSTIAGKDRLNIIVTTARISRAHVVELKADALNKLVAEFRAAVTNPSLNPRPSGKRLYDVLFPAGLKRDLAGAEADTIVWSLDGALRYVPMAALWDGEKYLAERYAGAVITLASRDKLSLPPAAREGLSILGAGVSKETKVAGSNGETRTFSALGAVPEELCDIVADETKREFCARLARRGDGRIGGVSLLDEEFTLAAFKLNLIRHPFVHIASHFSLNTGSEANSYLLLGSGEDGERKLTLKRMRDELGTKFAGVDLLTLSACNTAMGAGERSGGEEIEGFGALAQEQGAKSVLATLWAVADRSTQLLMSEFYRLLKENPGLSKAEALRRAQAAVASGRLQTDAAEGVRRDTGEIEIMAPTAAKYSHPYYWSPFVLMGNWR
jgi:CHAT domain-containing protein/Tfp pilus assembly protein PilF